MESLREYLLEQARERPWVYDQRMVSDKSPVEWAEEALKQALMEKYFQELPYQTGIKVVSWVPKLSGEIRIDYQLDVRNDIQVGMLLGEGGRILKETRLRAAQILVRNIQRPVTMTITVVKRRNTIDAANQYDELHDVL